MKGLDMVKILKHLDSNQPEAYSVCAIGNSEHHEFGRVRALYNPVGVKWMINAPDKAMYQTICALYRDFLRNAHYFGGVLSLLPDLVVPVISVISVILLFLIAPGFVLRFFSPVLAPLPPAFPVLLS
jgi:hypothetical protein